MVRGNKLLKKSTETPSVNAGGFYNAGKTERGEINFIIPGSQIEAVVNRLLERKEKFLMHCVGYQLNTSLERKNVETCSINSLRHGLDVQLSAGTRICNRNEYTVRSNNLYVACYRKIAGKRRRTPQKSARQTSLDIVNAQQARVHQSLIGKTSVNIQGKQM